MEAYSQAVACGKNLIEMIKLDDNGLWILLMDLAPTPQEASWHLACAANKAAEFAHNTGS
jgi:hypothetical protein